ncbi:hypothetical protein AD944_00695 [Acetobacter tropicalis]|nr:hypothetical protein AD944_00695 [Acetobacter tropicalis]
MPQGGRPPHLVQAMTRFIEEHRQSFLIWIDWWLLFVRRRTPALFLLPRRKRRRFERAVGAHDP